MLTDESIKETVNEMIITRDTILTGYLVPVEKPGKDPRKPENYRPVILLSTYHKLVSQIILNRIGPYIKQLSQKQFAYKSLDQQRTLCSHTNI